MVAVRIRLVDGLIRSVAMSGHARDANGGEAGACAALSLPARSAAETLRALEGVTVEGGAAAPGHLEFTVDCPPGAATERTRGITDMTLNGMLSVQREYPRLCEIRIVSNDS